MHRVIQVLGVKNFVLQPGQDQRGTENGFIDGLQDRLNDFVVRNPDTDLRWPFLPVVLRHLVGRRQDEGIRPRRELPDQAVRPVADMRKAADI